MKVWRATSFAARWVRERGGEREVRRNSSRPRYAFLPNNVRRAVD